MVLTLTLPARIDTRPANSERILKQTQATMISQANQRS